jgi:tetratricopeptide (TPR) repeat protein
MIDPARAVILGFAIVCSMSRTATAQGVSSAVALDSATQLMATYSADRWRAAEQILSSALASVPRASIARGLLLTRLGELYIRGGPVARSFPLLREATVLLARNPAALAEAEVWLGQAHWLAGGLPKRGDSASVHLQRALQSARQSRNPDMEALASVAAAVAITDRGDFSLADSILQAFENRHGVVRDSSLVVPVWIQQGVLAYKLHHDSMTTFRLFTRADELSRRLNFTLGTAEVAIAAADYWTFQGRYDLAIPAYEHALRVLGPNGEPGVIGNANSSLGTVHLYNGLWNQAESVLRTAFMIYTRLGWRRAQAESARLSGNALLGQKKYDQALSQLDEAEHISNDTTDRAFRAKVANSRGIALVNGRGDYVAAADQFAKALELGRDYEVAAKARLNLAGVLKSLDPDRSLSLYLQSAEDYRRQDLPSDLTGSSAG